MNGYFYSLTSPLKPVIIVLYKEEPMISNHVIDRFHSHLMDNDQFNEAVMSVALQVVQSYAPGEPLTDKDYDLAMELCSRVSVS